MIRLLRSGLLITLYTIASACSQEPTGTSSANEAPVESPSADTDVSAESRPLAVTTAGPVRGFTENGVLVFKGVRYGADTATSRFRAPQRPEPWSEPLDASQFGASAIQIPYPPGTAGGLFESWAVDPVPPMSEDCLFLNVWTPALADGANRPVMVWLHGGGLTRGSGSSRAYDGVRLVDRGDVVVITVNHRLNVFGYTYLGKFGDQFADSGNAGILDLILSLEWVRDNARAFGGDPTNVTIFGESGGGFKVSTLMGMEAAAGLFHRAIVQSGPTLEILEKDDAAEAASALVTELGLTAETVSELDGLPAETILAAYQTLNASGTSIGGRPVLDGENLTRHPFSPDANPLSHDVPMLIGTTRTENSLFIGPAFPGAFELTWEQLPAALATALNREDLDVAEIIAGYRRLQPGYDPTDVLFTATTDGGFLNRSHLQADRKANAGGAPTWFYMLDWDTPVDGGKWRAPHALDIGMAFDNVAYSESMSGVGPEQQQIADIMSEAWLAFARTGNPGHSGLPEWPVYEADSRMVMMFANEARVAPDPHGPERALLQSAGQTAGQ